MHLTDLLNKKIINICDGELMGQLGDADMLINEENGSIEALIVQESRRRSKSIMGERGEKHIPWSAVKKIGGEIIVVDFELI